MRGWFLVVGLGCLAGPAGAQGPPATDIYLVPVKTQGATLIVGPPKNLTHRRGFDNQPSFSPDGKSLFYTVVHGGGPKGTDQADIFRVDLASGRAVAVTTTPESEYSANVIPGTADISVIRVEVDSTQRLWACPLKGGAPRLLFDRIKPVGYQAWLSATTVGLFVLGSPPTLRLAEVTTGDSRVALSDIGRALQPSPGSRALSVSHQTAENEWWVVEIDPATLARTPVAKLPAGAEFFVWLPDGSLLTASGKNLLRRVAGGDWVVAATVAVPGSISRLALSRRGDWLALVADDSAP
jgi:hypothetical protein